MLRMCDEEWREEVQVGEGNVVPFLDRREPMPHPPTSPSPDIRNDSRACEAKRSVSSPFTPNPQLSQQAESHCVSTPYKQSVIVGKA